MDIKKEKKVEGDKLGSFKDIPIELTRLIVQYLPRKSVRNFRDTCHFFTEDQGLREIEKSKKRWDIQAINHSIYYLSPEGKAIGVYGFRSHVGIVLSSGQAISKVVLDDQVGFLADNQGNWYINAPIGSKKSKLIDSFPYQDIITGSKAVLMRDRWDNWYHFAKRSKLSILDQDLLCYYHPPQLVTLPNQKRIVKAMINKKIMVFKDEGGQWFGYVNAGEKYSFVVRPYTEACFKNISIKLTNNKAIKDIVLGNEKVLLQDESGDWFCYVHNGDNLVPEGEDKKLVLPNGKPIVKIIAGSRVFFCDSDGDWFAWGGNEKGSLGIGYPQPNQLKIQAVSWENKRSKIVKIIIAEDISFFLNDYGVWYGSGLAKPEFNGFAVSSKPVPIDFNMIAKRLNEEKTSLSVNIKK